jgi:hypothetical protein
MNAEPLILRARALLTENADAVDYPREHLFALIPIALADLQKQMEADGESLDSFKQTSTVTPVAGVADLSSLVALGLRLDKLKHANIIVNYAAGNPFQKTVQFVNSYDRLTSRSVQDGNYIFAFLDGNKLYLRDNTILPSPADPTASFTTPITITTVYRATTVTALGDDLIGPLAKQIAMLASIKRSSPSKTSALFMSKS